MSNPRKKLVRMSGWDLDDGLFDAAEKIRLEKGKTWRAMLSDALALLVSQETKKSGGDEI